VAKRAISPEKMEKKMLNERHTVDISSERETWGSWMAKPFTGLANWWQGEEVTPLTTPVPELSDEITAEAKTFILELIANLDSHHEEEGIFRVAGVKSNITDMRNGWIASSENPNNISDALRQELRERSHVFGKIQGDTIKELGKVRAIPINRQGDVIGKIKLGESEVNTLSAAVRGLPPINREILKKFLSLCVALDSKSDVNRMSKSKLAMMAGKCLMEPMSLPDDPKKIGDPSIMAEMMVDDNAITQGFLLLLQHFEDHPDVYKA